MDEFSAVFDLVAAEDLEVDGCDSEYCCCVGFSTYCVGGILVAYDGGDVFDVGDSFHDLDVSPVEAVSYESSSSSYLVGYDHDVGWSEHVELCADFYG